MTTPQHTFIESFREVQRSVHDVSTGKGWWRQMDDLEQAASGSPFPSLGNYALLANQLSSLALVHSEISEAVDGLRNGNPPDGKIPQFSAVEVELADAIIRIMDMAEACDWNVAGALLAKMDFNATRPHMHGKKV